MSEIEKKTKGKLELRLTEEEKIILKTAAARNGKPVNKYVMDLVEKDNKKKDEK